MLFVVIQGVSSMYCHVHSVREAENLPRALWSLNSVGPHNCSKRKFVICIVLNSFVLKTE